MNRIFSVKKRKLYFTVHDKPIYIEEANETTGRRWISRLPEPRDGANYSLTLVWRGRYESDTRYNGAWLKGAKQWSPGGVPCTLSNNCVDDTDDRLAHPILLSLHSPRGLCERSCSFVCLFCMLTGLADKGEPITC